MWKIAPFPSEFLRTYWPLLVALIAVVHGVLVLVVVVLGAALPVL